MRIDGLTCVLVMSLLAADVCAQQSAAAPSAPMHTGTSASPANRSERARAYFGDDLLIDQDNQPQRFYSDLLDGRTVLINVVFTHCPSACPLMTQKLKRVRSALGTRFGRDIWFLSLSVDPARDTPALMKAFATKQGADAPGWRFLTADSDTLQRVLGRLGQWTDDAENHSTLLIAGNAAQAHWSKLRPDAPPERIAADLERLSE